MTDTAIRLLQFVLPRRVFYRNFYLRSDHWARTAAEARTRAGHRCQRCRTAGRLDVHHVVYDHLWREYPVDLMVLCRTCHNKIHGRRARWRSSHS